MVFVVVRAPGTRARHTPGSTPELKPQDTNAHMPNGTVREFQMCKIQALLLHSRGVFVAHCPEIGGAARLANKRAKASAADAVRRPTRPQHLPRELAGVQGGSAECSPGNTVNNEQCQHDCQHAF